MRLIDADALNLEYEVDMADDWKTAHEMANIVKYAPTVDAVPVIRCEACRFWEPFPNQTVDTDMHKCRKWSVTTHIRGYCYKGEKKDA